jgi:hypothetical protein
MHADPARMRHAIAKALQIAFQSSQVDGDHHKAWVLDQMVRALTGCPLVEKSAIDCRNQPYTYKGFGESELYETFIAKAKAGEDGPDTYDWDLGIPP